MDAAERDSLRRAYEAACIGTEEPNAALAWGDWLNTHFNTDHDPNTLYLLVKGCQPTPVGYRDPPELTVKPLTT